MKLLSCVAAILIAANTALAQSPDEAASSNLGLIKKETIRYVPSGKSRMVYFATFVKPDCSLWDLKEFDVRISKAPEHGTVELTPGESFVAFEGKSAHCSGKKYRGTSINYKSSAGFTGSDEFEALILAPGGWAVEQHFKINEKGK